MSRSTYALVFYLAPFCVILAAELFAVFTGRSSYTITQWLTSMPSSLLYALTAFAGVWTGVHWKETYEERKRRKEREKGQRG